MMSIFIEGTLLGLSLAFLFGFGPAFFALIQTGLYRGFFAGVLLAFGVILNDLLIVTISILGATTILGGVENFAIVGIIGGMLLIIFGIFTYRKKTEIEDSENKLQIKTPHPIIYIAKGFLLNAVNPFVWIFWISVVVGITARFNADTVKLIIFFAGTLSVVWFVDIIKTFAASKLKKIVTNKFLILVNKIAGIAISGFGVFLIIRSIIM
jgi:threonine/homoserine/homoserine lactone efflux protein